MDRTLGKMVQSEVQAPLLVAERAIGKDPVGHPMEDGAMKQWTIGSVNPVKHPSPTAA